MSTSNRRILIERIPLVPPANNEGASEHFSAKEHFLKVEVTYSKGEMNYFSGTKPARGFYVRATPVYEQKHLNDAGEVTGTMEGFTMFSGLSHFLAPAARFSEKALAKVAATVKSDPHYEHLKAAVIDKERLTVAQEATS